VDISLTSVKRFTGILNLVYCYLFLLVSLAVIQAIYIEMFFCKESMSVPFSSFPWILAMLWRMLSRLETCIVYSCIWSVKSIVPRKTWRKLWHSCISKLFLTKMQVKFSIFFHHGNVSPFFLFPLNSGISWKWTEISLFWLEYLSVLCLKVSIAS
jgi:hypothetical protein